MVELATVIDIIRKRGVMRSDAIAAALLENEAAVDDLLEPSCRDGLLVSCAVELAGGRHVNEYRMSLNGGGKLVAFKPLYCAPKPAARPRNESTAPQVSSVDQVAAALSKHGPMIVPELEKRVDIEHLTTRLGQWAQRGTFARLGKRGVHVVWGMPDQKAPEAKTDTPPRAIHERKKKSAKRAGGGSVAVRRKARVKSKRAFRTFRPALAADGAILLLGAKRGEFAIERAHARSLVDITRRLTAQELTDLVMFVTRLDKAEVGV